MRAGTFRRWDGWLLAGWILAFAVIRASRLEDTDPYWQVVAGREVLSGMPLVRPDSWSWSPVEGLFYPNSPAWNIALARAWDLAGSWGMFVVTALTIVAYFVAAAYLARRLGAGPLAMIASLIVTSLVALPMLSPRATLASQALLTASVAFAAFWSSRSTGRRGALNALVVGLAGFALSATGNWVHLSWSSLALVISVAWAAIWWISPDIERPSRVAMTLTGTLGMILGIAAGPYGFSSFARSGSVLEACRGLVIEWTSALDPELAARWAIPATVAIAVSAAAVVWCTIEARRGQRRSSRLAVVISLTLISLPASIAGLAAIRFIGIAMMTIAPVTALLVSVGMRWMHAHFVHSRGPASRAAEFTGSNAWRVLLTAVLVVISPFVVFLARSHAQPATYAATIQLPFGCQLFSTDAEAAAVILLRPDVRIWIDGRADYWGRERMQEYRRVTTAVDPADPVPSGTTCVLLPSTAADPELAGLTSALDASSDWARLAGTGDAVVWVPQAD